MSRIFRWHAPVWQADIGAFGDLHTSTLVRFLQETATRASTDAGFDPKYYEQIGGMWLVRRTTLTLLGPIRYGDEMESTTWVADFRRVRSRRDYDVRTSAGLVARAETDWVFVDRVHGRPRRVPSEMESVFMPDGAITLARVPLRIAAAPAAATRHERRVDVHELDALRHVNNASYVDYIEQAALDAAAAAGWDLARQIEHGGHLRPTAHDLEYLEAAVYGELLTILTWPVAVTSDGIERCTVVSGRTPVRPLLHAFSAYTWVAESGVSMPLPASLRIALATSSGSATI
jgi:acyl-CoA thioester hydrolase